MMLLGMIHAEPLEQFLLLVVGYLLGSIPFAWIIARLKGVNLFEVGSGSSGATNAARAIGWRWFFPIFALDAGKGAGAVLIGLWWSLVPWYFIDGTIFAIIGAVLGHTFSPWLKFRGGKAVATGVGAVLALSPATGGIALACFALCFFATRYVSVGSIAGAISVPISYAFFGDPQEYMLQRMILLTCVSVFVIWKHRTNIERLLNGTEKRAVKKKQPDPASADEASA